MSLHTELMAQKAKAVLDKVKKISGGDSAKNKASSQAVTNTLDTKMLDGLIGHQTEMNKVFYKYTITRPDVNLTEQRVAVSTFLGCNTWAAFQGTVDKAAVAGDFTILENEAAPVLKALFENEIEVVALHNHLVHEQPRIYFLHCRGVGNAERLAKALKAALDQTWKGEGKKMEMKME